MDSFNVLKMAQFSNIPILYVSTVSWRIFSIIKQQIQALVNPSRPNLGRREKIKFLFSRFFVVPQKVL